MNLRTQQRRSPRILAAFVAATGLTLFGVFAAMVLLSRRDLQREIHRRMVERDAAVIQPFAVRQVADERPQDSRSPLTVLLRGAQQEGMLAIAIFDREGNTLEAVPSTQLFVDLPVDDFVALQTGGRISRYHPQFPLDQYFADIAPGTALAPVLEVVIPVRPSRESPLLGFVRYYLDARPLARELAAIDAHIGRQTAATLLIGGLVVALVMSAAAYGLARAQRTITERNDRLARAHFELTLAAKTSVLGQITSHLIHGLQGPVAGLRAAVANPANPDWDTAAAYTERLQSMVQETVALLRDIGANASYEIDGAELAAAIRERNQGAATQRGVQFAVATSFRDPIDSHRGGLLCLIASNLAQNAIAATPVGKQVTVRLEQRDRMLVLEVCDEGHGIPDALRPHLFVPGRSGRSGGSGLGLAISQLLARQLGAELVLAHTGTDGTVFRLSLPHTGP